MKSCVTYWSFLKNQCLALIFLFLAPGLVLGQAPLPKEVYAARREALRKNLPASSAALLFANDEKIRSNDVEYEFHQHPDFFYLTGLNEPNAALLIFQKAALVNGHSVDEVLILPSRDLKQETWTGKRLGTEGAKRVLGFINAVATDSLLKDLKLIPNPPANVFLDNADQDLRGDLFVDETMKALCRQFQNWLFASMDGKPKIDNETVVKALALMRQVKSTEELAFLRSAINITCDAQIELQKAIDTTYSENQAEALIEYMFRAAGASGPAFPSIIGSGENTCILHYTENNSPCAAGDLMVVDIGAEYLGYAADVTRTIPVDGTYSPAQKAIYELVLEAQAKGFEACQKGNPFSEPGKRATEVIANGLVKLGIIAKTSEVRTYFIHGTSHYLGLDVHDAGNYDKLSPGNVITVEPGIYIPFGSPCDSKWWNIGVRIEDDVLILEKGYEVLSEKAPRSIAEIEKIMQAESFFNNKPDFLIK